MVDYKLRKVGKGFVRVGDSIVPFEDFDKFYKKKEAMK